MYSIYCDLNITLQGMASLEFIKECPRRRVYDNARFARLQPGARRHEPEKLACGLDPDASRKRAGKHSWNWKAFIPTKIPSTYSEPQWPTLRKSGRRMDSNSSTLNCSKLFSFSNSFEEIGERTCNNTQNSGTAVGIPLMYGTKCTFGNVD